MGALNGGVPSMVKSIQRGTIAFSTGTAALLTRTATISSVDTTKSEVELLGYSADTGNGAGAPRLTLTDATTVSAVAWTPASVPFTVQYQVTERY